MLLETLLQQHEPPHEITNIFVRSNVTFFKIHGESFCTAAGKVAHHTSPVFDSSFLHVIAAEAHDDDTRDRMAAAQKDYDIEYDLWTKHQVKTCELLFAMALQVLHEHGEDAMKDFIHDQFDIYPTGGMQMVKKIAKGL